MTNLKKQIRTCISCREKQVQKKLNRFQCIDKNLTLFTGSGRSFYLCNDCLDDKVKCEKALFRHCKHKNDYFEQLCLLLK